jgi:hypothetical protein
VKPHVVEQRKDRAWADGQNTADGVVLAELIPLDHLNNVLEFVPTLPNEGKREQAEGQHAIFFARLGPLHAE